MVALFPDKQLGVELGSIILIFTGQVWNMAFSFYSSLKSIPRELREASAIYRFGKWQRFFQLELPYGTIGLIWNSIVSVAGGWFFLMACEMFVLGKRDFRLPGLGSYLQTAAGNGDTCVDALGPGGHDRRDSSDRPARLAAGHCMVEQIQIRAGGKRAMSPRLPCCISCEIPTPFRVFREKTHRAVERETQPLLRARRSRGRRLPRRLRHG